MSEQEGQGKKKRKKKNIRPAETNSLDTKRKQLEDIRAAANTAVGEDDDLVKDVGGVAVDLVGNLDGSGGELELAAAVVGQVDAVDAALDGLQGVLDGLDALQDDGEVGARAELVIDFPLVLRARVSRVFLHDKVEERGKRTVAVSG